MHLRLVILASAAGAVVATCVLAQQAPSPNPPPQVPGYLTAQTMPDVARILAPPPPEGGPRQKQDLDIFQATRALQGTPRWALATADVSYAIPDLLRDFSCAAGMALTPENAPKTANLIRRVLRDTGATASGAKQVFQRKRPYLYVDGPICVAKSDDLAKSPDYPSGHSTLSWGVGMVLSELMPDHATALMSRARAYGESRLVCGVHTLSAIEAGRFTASAAVAAEHGSPEFRADMDAARAELTTLRSSAAAPSPDACQAEFALTGKPPY
jgi:acid phosphatase (class A)